MECRVIQFSEYLARKSNSYTTPVIGAPYALMTLWPLSIYACLILPYSMVLAALLSGSSEPWELGRTERSDLKP